MAEIPICASVDPFGFQREPQGQPQSWRSLSHIPKRINPQKGINHKQTQTQTCCKPLCIRNNQISIRASDTAPGYLVSSPLTQYPEKPLLLIGPSDIKGKQPGLLTWITPRNKSINSLWAVGWVHLRLMGSGGLHHTKNDPRPPEIATTCCVARAASKRLGDGSGRRRTRSRRGSNTPSVSLGFP